LPAEAPRLAAKGGKQPASAKTLPRRPALPVSQARQFRGADGADGMREGPYGVCYVIGTWDAFSGRNVMTWDGHVYRYCLWVREGATEESFQILADGSWDSRIFPSINDANPYVAHRVFGPETGGHGLNWTIGRDSRDGIEGGARYEVVMLCPSGAPISVSWAKHKTANVEWEPALPPTAPVAEHLVNPVHLNPMLVQTCVRQLREKSPSEATRGIHAEVQGESSPYGKCYLIGSWDGFEGRHEMSWDGSGYWYHVQCTKTKESFQILCGGWWDNRIYPTKADANPHTQHEIKGPDGGGHGLNWTIGQNSEDRCGIGAKFEIVLGCPRGRPVSVGWVNLSAQYRQMGAALAALPVPAALIHFDFNEERPSAPVPRLPPGSRVGRWQVRGVLGLDNYDGLVYLVQWPDMGVNGYAAMKFPVSYEELDSHSLLHDITGVPDLLDFGEHLGGYFLATPVLFPSLQNLLQGCDHDGLGGRLSWAFARGLAKGILSVLQSAHKRGIIHGGLSPQNVLLPIGGTAPYIIGFEGGLHRIVRRVGVMSCVYDFMSIRAGHVNGGHVSFPSDDLEALGWLLLHCVLGALPWRSAQEDACSESPIQAGMRISEAKSKFLSEGRKAFGTRFAYCPPALEEYFRRVRSLDSRPVLEDVDYGSLISLLSDDASGPWEELAEAWCGLRNNDAEERCARESSWPLKVVVLRGRVVWRPANAPLAVGTESTTLVTKNLCLRLTGRMRKCDQGGEWLEIDPVWAPKQPQCLASRNWVLRASPPGKHGQLLADI